MLKRRREIKFCHSRRPLFRSKNEKTFVSPILIGAGAGLTPPLSCVSMGIHIRRYSLNDAAAVVEAARESLHELRPWMPWCHPGYSIRESRSWLEIQVPAFEAGTAYEFAIVSADGQFLGGCGLNQIDQVNQRQSGLLGSIFGNPAGRGHRGSACDPRLGFWTDGPHPSGDRHSRWQSREPPSRRKGRSVTRGHLTASASSSRSRS